MKCWGGEEENDLGNNLIKQKKLQPSHHFSQRDFTPSYDTEKHKYNAQVQV